MRVFLSYTHSDLQHATAIRDEIASNGHDVWLDTHKLLPGQDWKHEIRAAIRQAEAVALLLSPRSVTKVGYVQKEIRLALDAADERPTGSVFILPLRVGKVEIPDRLAHLQCVDFENAEWSRKLEQALDLIRKQ